MIFFLGATLLTMVTMLNMVIAIMGDTFDRLTEERALNSMKIKLELAGEITADGEYL